MYAAEWPCCHDPLRFSLGSDDLLPRATTPSSDRQAPPLPLASRRAPLLRGARRHACSARSSWGPAASARRPPPVGAVPLVGVRGPHGALPPARASARRPPSPVGGRPLVGVRGAHGALPPARRRPPSPVGAGPSALWACAALMGPCRQRARPRAHTPPPAGPSLCGAHGALPPSHDLRTHGCATRDASRRKEHGPHGALQAQDTRPRPRAHGRPSRHPTESAARGRGAFFFGSFRFRYRSY